MQNKKLYRSSVDKKLFGVCGGIADYFDIDSALVRIFAFIGILMATVGIWVYLVLALILKYNPDVIDETTYHASRKKLYRSRKNSMLFGVCGGLADYFDIDSGVLRIIMVLLFFTGFGFIFYISAGIVLPIAPTEP